MRNSLRRVRVSNLLHFRRTFALYLPKCVCWWRSLIFFQVEWHVPEWLWEGERTIRAQSKYNQSCDFYFILFYLNKIRIKIHRGTFMDRYFNLQNSAQRETYLQFDCIVMWCETAVSYSQITLKLKCHPHNCQHVQ